ncbi:MAG: AAA family ATPase [Planctomycetes bacterium]|nr:AAA family ATPase [Planctomycetota bacterium]
MNKRKSVARPDRASSRQRPHVASYFASLKLRNVRCFGDRTETLNLCDQHGTPAQWTILIGDNGCGKTTVLQALAAFDRTSIEVTHYPESEKQSVDVIRGLRWDFHRFRRNFSRSDSTESPFVSARIATGRGLGNSASEFRLAEHEWVPHRRYPGFGHELPVCYGYGATRRLGGVSLKKRMLEDATASLFSDRAELRNAEEWLLQLDYAASKQSAAQESRKAQLELAQATLLSALPEGEVTAIRFAEPTKSSRTPRVEFQTPFGWVSLLQLGHGYRTMVAWIMDLVSRLVERYPDSKNPLEEPAVVLIDEIDLHLHPTWQRKIVGYLTDRFPNTQFVATAHSPLIVQSAASVNANIALLRRDGDHVVIDNDQEAIRGWRVDQILTSDLFNLPTARPPEFDDLLRQRKQILSKPRLSKKDEAELAELDKTIGYLPTGERADDQRTQELIAEAAELLKRHSGMSG